MSLKQSLNSDAFRINDILKRNIFKQKGHFYGLFDPLDER